MEKPPANLDFINAADMVPMLQHTTVFLHALPMAWTELELMTFLNTIDGAYAAEVENIVAVSIAYHPPQGGVTRGKGLALVAYATVELANYAVLTFEAMEVAGRTISARISDKAIELKADGRRVIRGQPRWGVRLWRTESGPMDPKCSSH